MPWRFHYQPTLPFGSWCRPPRALQRGQREALEDLPLSPLDHRPPFKILTHTEHKFLLKTWNTRIMNRRGKEKWEVTPTYWERTHGRCLQNLGIGAREIPAMLRRSDYKINHRVCLHLTRIYVFEFSAMITRTSMPVKGPGTSPQRGKLLLPTPSTGPGQACYFHSNVVRLPAAFKGK